MKNIMKPILVFLSLTVTALAMAHHSFAIFDFDTKIPFEGTIETVSFRNPHIAMTLRVTTEGGSTEIINFIEGAPANMLVRSGIKPNMMKVGTHIKTLGSPKIETPNEYFLRSIFLDDGTTVEF